MYVALFSPRLLSATDSVSFSQGPDEVHLQQIGKQELKRVPQLQERNAGIKQRETQLMREAKL